MNEYTIFVNFLRYKVYFIYKLWKINYFVLPATEKNIF